MEDSTEGLTLPQFSGRLSADWSTHEQRLRSWLAVHGIPPHAHEAAQTLSLSLSAQAALAFEHEAGGVERFTFDEAARWCRERWGGRERQSFRERGKRREGVKDLINDVELLFLQAGVLDDEAQRRAFISCFFEFPHCLSRLSRSSSYAGAVAEALAWEADMVRKEREALAMRVHITPSLVSTSPPHPATEPDYERPRNPARPSLSPIVQARFVEHMQTPPAQDEEPRDPLVAATAGQHRRTPSHLRPYPSRSTETLNISVRSIEREREREQHAGPARAHSSLAAYPFASAGAEAYRTTPLATRARPHLPASFAPASLAPPPSRPSTSRTPTPPFVTEATSFRSSYTSGDGETGDGATHAELYEQFPYPARPSPTGGSFATFRVAAATEARGAPRGVGEQLWRSTSPLQRREAPEHERRKTLGRASRLAKLFKRGLHGRSKSIGSGAELALALREEEEKGEMGRPPKPRGKVVREGLQLPP
ncbi:hypothetical protein JCM10450v2_000744 [Rhodotorula kratochvilovae]